MASLMFYQQPVALNKAAHKQLRLDRAEREFAFAGETNSVVLAGIEFAEASKEYPVVFAAVGEKDGQQKVVPVSLLGMRNSENLFIDQDGKWTGRYVPAFIRRYPFVLAEVENTLTVCIDQACSKLQETSGEALFDEDGNNTKFLDNVLAFLGEYQKQYLRTEKFVEKLQALELLKPLNAAVKLNDGEQLGLHGMLVVDERKLLELADDKALELFRSGELGWIYTHLASIANLGRLVDRVAEQKQQSAATEPQTKH